jgi:hypothetical protein
MPQLATSWSAPCTIHTLIFYKPQIMWNFSTSQSTLIQVNQINVESQNNEHHIKSPFWCNHYIKVWLFFTQNSMFQA